MAVNPRFQETARRKRKETHAAGVCVKAGRGGLDFNGLEKIFESASRLRTNLVIASIIIVLLSRSSTRNWIIVAVFFQIDKHVRGEWGLSPTAPVVR